MVLDIAAQRAFASASLSAVRKMVAANSLTSCALSRSAWWCIRSTVRSCMSPESLVRGCSSSYGVGTSVGMDMGLVSLSSWALRFGTLYVRIGTGATRTCCATPGEQFAERAGPKLCQMS
jgi:hypothetical protein